MRKCYCLPVCLIVLAGLMFIATEAAALEPGPGGGEDNGSARGGGDVLRPGGGVSGYIWYLGFDAGLTYSIFQNGPLSYYSPNPYNEDFPLDATFEDGSGLGFHLGAVADFPLSDMFGLVTRLNYQTRSGSSTKAVFPVQAIVEENGIQYYVDATVEDEIDWQFDYFSLDLLLRIQLMREALYMKAGFSYGFLLSNNAELRQRILAPDEVYYVEKIGDAYYDIINNYKEAESSGEVTGFAPGRFDLMLGLGTWIPLSDDLLLVPELMLAYPLTTIVDETYINDEMSTLADPLRIYRRMNPVIDNNKDFNMMTFFFTVGLRWRIGS